MSALDEENDNSSSGNSEEESSYSGDSEYSSSSSYEAEWADHINSDGSVLYIESYMSSTVREKQEQVLKLQPEKKPSFPNNEKQMKKQNRLLGLLKRRPSIRVKKSGDTNTGEESSRGGAEASPLKVTFRDNPSGEVRMVQLHMTEQHTSLGRRASLCEVVLGVVPGRFGEPPDARIMVAGLVPGSEALRSAVIKIGDWLKEVNGITVTLDNVDSVIQTIQIPSVVSVVVQKCASETLPHHDEQDNKKMVQTTLVKLISETESSSPTHVLQRRLKDLPHTVLYLSLTGVKEHDPDGADIRYQFPNWSNKLVSVRGMFITIAHTVEEALGSPAQRTTVLIDEDYYHIAYCRDDKDVFLMALPHDCVSEHEIVAHMKNLSRLLKYEFGSLSNGLTNPDNKNYIDHLLSMMLGQLLANPRQFVSNLNHNTELKNVYHPILTSRDASNCRPVLQAPSLLLLNDSNVLLQIDNCLNELEAGDFGDDDFDCEQCDMLYSIVGTCLFYKNHLIRSHVTGSDLTDMWLFASYHSLLHLVSNEAVSQLVSWRKVVPSVTMTTIPNCKVEHYVLFVAMNHMLLGMLVESGNITELIEDMSGPDPVLVDQIETTLYQLHGFHIHSFCEESILHGGIEKQSVDDHFKSSSFKKIIKPTFTDKEGMKAPDVPSILKQRSSPLPELYVHAGEAFQEEGEVSEDTHSSLESPSSHNNSLTDQESIESDWQIWKQSKEGYNFDVGHTIGLPKSPIHPFSVTVGKENVLFHLVHLDSGDGYVVETLPLDNNQQSIIGQQVAHNFKLACAHIHHILHAPNRIKELNGSNYSGSNMFNGINEHGIMFSLNSSQASPSSSKNNPSTIDYWVIGRHINGSPPSEIYFCYDDRISQNVQEVAYNLIINSSYG